LLLVIPGLVILMSAGISLCKALSLLTVEKRADCTIPPLTCVVRGVLAGNAWSL
jgi:type II secretory pathway component PulF